MGRPIKDGLDYFPIDLDIMDEDSVGYVDAKYGIKAFGLLVRLLIRIYRNGYFMMWSEREQYLFTKDISVDIEATKTIVNAYINEGFFNKNLFEKYGLLTSHGIQKRYLKACERRKKIIMIKEYYLIKPDDDVKTDNVTLTTINDDINPSKCDTTSTLSTTHTENDDINVDMMSTKTPQSKVKESKEKKSKENARAREDSKPVDNFFEKMDGSDDLYSSGKADEKQAAADDGSDFMSFWNAYPKHLGMAKAVEEWKILLEKGIKPDYLILAAKQYAIKVLKNQTETQFIKMPNNFLMDGSYLEYLPRNLPGCPKCGGKGYYEDEDNRTAICDCRKLFRDKIAANSA